MGESSVLRRSLLISAGLGLFGAGLLSLSAFTITSFVSAVMNREPIIFWDEGGWIALPIALALLALALALYIGRHDGQNVDGRRSDTIRRLLILAACLLPFVIVFPLGMHWLASPYLEARGYNECIYGVWIAVGRVPDVANTPAPCRSLSAKPESDRSRP
jgi:hypothetical protein